MESTATMPRATGPRTAAGKRRSRMNAIKHGFFSKHLLLEGEDPAEYEKLHRDLRNDWQPVGRSMDVEVERLASLYWRQRRIPTAEAASISRSPGFVGIVGRPDLPNPHLLHVTFKNGSVVPPPKVVLLDYAAEVLYELEKKIGEPELKLEVVLNWLRSVYECIGDPAALLSYEQLVASLFRLYSRQTRSRGSMDASDLVSETRELLLAEAQRFHQLRDDERLKDVTNTSLASLIPSQNDLDRIIRYESHISREIDRSISRLERMQRARRSRSSSIRVDLES